MKGKVESTGEMLIWCEEKRTAPNIHKSLSDPVWEKSRKIELSGEPATSAYLLRSADGLYIGFHCLIDDEKKPRGEKRERDGWMFAHGDDIVSVFIDEKHNHLEYYQFALNAYGTQYDARRTASGAVEDKGWDGAWEADARIYDGYWEAKFFIPFSDLGIEPEEGDTLGLNLCRECGTVRSVWSPVIQHFHEPEKFGTLLLGNREMLPITIDFDKENFDTNKVTVTVENVSGASKNVMCKMTFVDDEEKKKEFSSLPVNIASKNKVQIKTNYEVKKKGAYRARVSIIDNDTRKVFYKTCEFRFVIVPLNLQIEAIIVNLNRIERELHQLNIGQKVKDQIQQEISTRRLEAMESLREIQSVAGKSMEKSSNRSSLETKVKNLEAGIKAMERQANIYRLTGDKFGEYFTLKIEDDSNWSFLNGCWIDGPTGELIPSGETSRLHWAFWSARAFSDFNAEFEVRFGFPGGGGARFFFRVQDATKYYAFDLPFCGQQVRTRAAWGLMTKGDGSGLDQYLNLSLLQRVIPEYERWYAVHIEASGTEFRVWVDGEPLPPVRDESYVSGFIGIGSYGGMAVFRNLRIAGKTCEFEKLLKEVSVPNLAFIPWETSEPEKQEQSGGSFCRTDGGDILCAFSAGGHAYLSRSRDGRRWTSPEPLPGAGVSYIRTGTAGQIILQIRNGESMLRYESHDNGHTWSAPLSAYIDVPETVDSLHPGSGRTIREMSDGSLITFWFGPVKKSLGGGNGHSGIATWGKVAWQAFCLRSTDGGRSWGKPVNLDKTLGSRGKYVEPREMECNYDLTETDGGWVEGNRCLALIRPVYLPWMWESWSEDDGKTWGPAKIGPFPGWVPTFLRLKDGKLLVTHRYPYLTAHVSVDGGRTWSKGTRIAWMDDGVTGMFEIEPGRVLILYSGKGNGGLLQGLFVRVESNGVFPE